jgi:hypothetical protein
MEIKKMKSNSYFYHKIDSRKNKNLYQYSKYSDIKLINDFYKSRKEILNLKHNKNYHLIKDKFSFKKIKILCRKYEINKKLFFDKKEEREYTINHYINFSKAISIYLKKKLNYSILSTLLKINDLIVYLFTKKNDQEINFKDLKKAINLEILIIKKLVYEKKIK